MRVRVRASRVAGWWALSAVLALVGVSILALSGHEAAPPSVRSTHLSVIEPTRSSAPPAAQADPALQPVWLRIPALHVSTSLTTLALQPDRSVEVPADPEQAGWFRLGPPPGELGSSVILGHVDSVDGPAVFAGLRTLAPGDLIEIRRADGSILEFAVTELKTYSHADFPAHRIYAARGHRDLNLITCGGSYDRTQGGYQSNVVAYSRLVSETPIRG